MDNVNSQPPLSLPISHTRTLTGHHSGCAVVFVCRPPGPKQYFQLVPMSHTPCLVLYRMQNTFLLHVVTLRPSSLVGSYEMTKSGGLCDGVHVQNVRVCVM